jgi:hypothetical protein
MAEQVYLNDPTELSAYEIALEAQLAFNGVAEVMSDNFSPPVPVPPLHLMDPTERGQYQKDIYDWKKKEQKAFGIILLSLKNLHRFQRDLLALVPPDANGFRRGSTLLVALRGLIHARQGTTTIAIVEQKLDRLRLVGPTEADFDSLLSIMIRYFDVLEAHSHQSEQSKILKLQKCVNGISDFAKMIAIYQLFPNASFDSVCDNLRQHILAQTALLYEEAQKPERTHVEATVVNDSEKAKLNLFSKHPPARYGPNGARSASPHRGGDYRRSLSPKNNRSFVDRTSNDDGRLSDNDHAGYDSDHSRSHYKSSNRHRESNYNRGRSRDRGSDRSQSPSHVSFKLSRSGTPSPSRERSDGIELDKPNLQCNKCKGFGHKADVCPSAVKNKT